MSESASTGSKERAESLAEAFADGTAFAAEGGQLPGSTIRPVHLPMESALLAQSAPVSNVKPSEHGNEQRLTVKVLIADSQGDFQPVRVSFLDELRLNINLNDLAASAPGRTSGGFAAAVASTTRIRASKRSRSQPMPASWLASLFRWERFGG